MPLDAQAYEAEEFRQPVCAGFICRPHGYVEAGGARLVGVQFSSISSAGADVIGSYQWDFGDGQTSTDDRPVHAYRNDGVYTVSLKVTDDRGNTASFDKEKYITVLSGWEAGNTARSAWNGFVGFGHFFVNLIIWLGIFSPLWIVILVILYFAWWRRRKKAEK
jgi:hypothetical protein